MTNDLRCWNDLAEDNERLTAEVERLADTLNDIYARLDSLKWMSVVDTLTVARCRKMIAAVTQELTPSATPDSGSQDGSRME